MIVMPGSAVWGPLGRAQGQVEVRSQRGETHLPEGLYLQKTDIHWRLPLLELSTLVLSCLHRLQPQHCPWAVRWRWRRWLANSMQGPVFASSAVDVSTARVPGVWLLKTWLQWLLSPGLSRSNSLWVVSWEMCYQNSLPWYWRGFVDERKVVLTVENSFFLSTPPWWM